MHAVLENEFASSATLELTGGYCRRCGRWANTVGPLEDAHGPVLHNDAQAAFSKELWYNAELFETEAECSLCLAKNAIKHEEPPTGDYSYASPVEPEVIPAEAEVVATGPLAEIYNAGAVNITPAIREVVADMHSEMLTQMLSNQSKDTKYTAVSHIVVRHLSRIGAWYYNSDFNDFKTAMFFDRNRKLLLRVISDQFLGWVSQLTRVNRAAPMFKYISAQLSQNALNGEDTTGILPGNYWAAKNGAIYISQGDGQMVRIRAEGIEQVDNGTDGVLFALGRTLRKWSLVAPRDPFETMTVFRTAHSTDAGGQDLLKLWMYSFASSPRSKPVLCATGDVGSGKTRTMKAVSELYGIPTACSKMDEKKESDFWPAINAGGHFILDNADSHVSWLQDALAAAATDGCSVRRRLFTNDALVTLQANAWCSITSAAPSFAADAGLADRLLVVRMEPKSEETADESLSREIEEHRDSALSHICHALRGALADKTPTPPKLNKRHPDFAVFAVRIGRALNMEARAIACLQEAEAQKSVICTEANDTVQNVLRLVEQFGTFNGTAQSMLDALCRMDPALGNPRLNFTARRLAKSINQAWPHICTQVSAASKKPGHGGIMTYTLTAKPNPALAAEQDAKAAF